MKSERSLGDLIKKLKSFLKKSSNRIGIFMIVNFPMRPELVFLSHFVYWKLIIDSFCGVKCSFELIFLNENLNLKKSYTKSEGNHVN